MECTSCGEEVEAPHYFLEDEEMRWPLHKWCLNVVDLRLLLLEREAQGEIDQLVESQV